MPTWEPLEIEQNDNETTQDALQLQILDTTSNDGHDAVGGGTLLAAGLGIVKGMVGPAILYLPHGFASAGYLVALPIMGLSTLMFLYSSSCLLSSWRIEYDKERTKSHKGRGISPTTDAEQVRLMREPSAQTKPDGLNDTCHVPPLSYPELAKRGLGRRGESVVKVGVALMQFGVCLTYLIFVPKNLHACAKTLFRADIPADLWLILMIGIQIPLSWIQDIRRLTPTNFLANTLILYGLLTCMVFAAKKAVTAIDTKTVTPEAQNISDTIDSESTEVVSFQDSNGPIQNIRSHFSVLEPFASGWFLFIGTSVLLFEGSITLLVPLQESVDTEARRKQFPALYQSVILGIICFYVIFGIACWMAFGQDVNVVLTTSLPPGLISATVQLAYSVAVVFTFPLQNFPALEIVCKTIQRRLTTSIITSDIHGGQFLMNRNVISTFVVLLLALVAVATMESLDKVVSLMGSLLGCPIAFVFPPLIHSSLAENLSSARLFGNQLVAGLGVCAMVLASTTTILEWN